MTGTRRAVWSFRAAKLPGLSRLAPAFYPHPARPLPAQDRPGQHVLPLAGAPETRNAPMNAMSRQHLPHPTPLHLRIRISEALERRGIHGAAVEEGLAEACRIAAEEHQAAKEAAV